MAAAFNLTEVIVASKKAKNAHADHLLCASSSVLSIRSLDLGSYPSSLDLGSHPNTYIPSKLPQQLQQLEVSFVALAHKQRAKPQMVFRAFVSMMSSMPELRTLTLKCGTLVPECSMCLPKLAKLEVHISVWGKGSQLSWLHSQAYDQLDIHLVMHDCGKEGSQQVISELQQLHLGQLHLIMHGGMTAASQQIWQSYSGCDHFHLELDFWSRLPVVLHALPSCEVITLTDGRGHFHGHDGIAACAPGPLEILWQGLARPGRLLICQPRGSGIHIEGYASSLLDFAAPWQLVVHSPGSIDGLPPSRPISAPATYYQQNAAADVGGWDSMSQDSCTCVEMQHL